MATGKFYIQKKTDNPFNITELIVKNDKTIEYLCGFISGLYERHEKQEIKIREIIVINY